MKDPRQRAEGILGWSLGPAVPLYKGVNTLFRYAVRTPGQPRSVVLKQPGSPRDRLFDEWAALETFDGAGGLLPRIYGGDRESGLLLLEDMGDGEPYGRLLLHPQTRPQQAAEALITVQRAVARLHGASRGREARYHEIRAALPRASRSRHRVHHMAFYLEAMPSVFAAHGVSGAGMGAEIAVALAVLRDPGPFRCLTHGDATPANAWVSEGRVRLYDLESADWRHALVDGTFGEIRYLQSSWAFDIPAAIRTQMTAAYRAALAESIPEASDDRLFQAGSAAASAGWLSLLLLMLPPVLQADYQWGQTTFRQRVVTGLERFVALESSGLMPHLRQACATLSAQLRDRWPAADCDLPLYPPFRDHSG